MVPVRKVTVSSITAAMARLIVHQSHQLLSTLLVNDYQPQASLLILKPKTVVIYTKLLCL